MRHAFSLRYCFCASRMERRHDSARPATFVPSHVAGGVHLTHRKLATCTRPCALRQKQHHQPAVLRWQMSTSGESLSRRNAIGLLLSGAALGVGLGTNTGTAEARPEGVNRPDLLPVEYTTVIDLENFLASGDERRLREKLKDLETRTGFKVRILTQRYPVTPGLAVRDYWGVDDKTVVLVADYFAGGGSLLHYTVGLDVDALLPPRFWSVLTSKYGNRFYVAKNGEDGAILASVESIRTCLLSGGCQVPPKEASEFFR